jgi:EVE domain
VPTRTWILTGSPENLAATGAHDFSVIGLKERRRRQALEIELGDRIVFYVTKAMAFAASARIAGPLYEDRTPIWPGKAGQPDPYPWRFALEPEWILDRADWIAAETLVGQLEHIAKWPREHWKLAFQGQLRAVGDADAQLLCARLAGAAPVRA